MFGGYPPTAISYTPTAIAHPPTAVGYTPTAIGYPPAAIVGRIGHSEFFFFLSLRHLLGHRDGWPTLIHWKCFSPVAWDKAMAMSSTPRPEPARTPGVPTGTRPEPLGHPDSVFRAGGLRACGSLPLHHPDSAHVSDPLPQSFAGGHRSTGTALTLDFERLSRVPHDEQATLAPLWYSGCTPFREGREAGEQSCGRTWRSRTDTGLRCNGWSKVAVHPPPVAARSVGAAVLGQGRAMAKGWGQGFA